MSDSTKNINDLAAQYMDLWQKQLTAQGTDKMVNDAVQATSRFQEEAGEAMKSLDTPEKMQQWMNTWAETWKEQFNNEQNPFSQFTDMQQNWAKTVGAASGDAQHNVDEFEKRISALENRIAELEARLKD